MLNIYQGLEIEPFEPVPTVRLTARVIDPNHFVFLPETWEAQLKPFQRAKWKHDSIMYSGGSFFRCPHNYEIKQGVFLAFPGQNGGFYAVHLYQVVKAMSTNQARGTFTGEGLTIETIDGLPQRVHLKFRAIQRNDSVYRVGLELP